MSTSKTLTLNTFLPYRLSRVSNQISYGIEKLYEEQFGLTLTEWRVMAIIGDQSPLTAQEIVERTLMSKVSISRAINLLESKGLVQRSVNENDKRQLPIALSEKGQLVHDQIVPLALSYESELVAQLSDEHRSILPSLLDELDKVAQQLNQKIHTKSNR